MKKKSCLGISRFSQPEIHSDFHQTIMLENLHTLVLITGFLVLVEAVLWFMRDLLYGTSPIIFAGLVFNTLAFSFFFLARNRFQQLKPGPTGVRLMSWLIQLYCLFMTFYAIGVIKLAGPEHDVLHVFFLVEFAIAGFIYMPISFSAPFFLGSGISLMLFVWLGNPDPSSLLVEIVNTCIMLLYAMMVSFVIYRRKLNAFHNTKIIEAQNRKLSQLVEQDLMTSLYNHETILRKLESEIERAKRIGYPLSVMLFDLDDFKTVNDMFGHLSGDRVLKQLSAELVRFVRSTDVPGRYGGEEFLIVMPGADLTHATGFAERFRSHVESMDYGEGIRLTISGGICQWNGESAHELMRVVDLKLYSAKRMGKNRFEVA